LEAAAQSQVALNSQQQLARQPAAEAPAAPKAPRKVSYELPQGGAPELLAHIDELNQALVETAQSGESLEAIQTEVNKNLDAQLAATEKILTMRPQVAEGARVEAIGAKTRALMLKFQLQTPGAEAKLTAWTQELDKDPDKSVQNLAAASRLMAPLTKLKTGEVQDPKPAMTALNRFLGGLENFDASSFNYGVEAIQTFQSLGHLDEMISSMRSVGNAFQASSNAQVASAALELTQNAAQMMEFDHRMDEAKEVYAAIEQKAATMEDPELKKRLEDSVANFRKRISLVGQDFTLENMIDLDGKPIDWSKYQGKVVLIDFWATWCKPCINEFYNIAEVYAAYKDEGFEVISVNLDDNLEDVKRFFSQDRLEWTVAIPADPKQRGQENNPLAVKCGVEAIPFVLLVDQSGKVTAIQTHGPCLAPAVRKLLNITEDASAPAPSSVPPAVVTPPSAPATEAPEPSAPPAEAAPKDAEELELNLPLQPATRRRPRIFCLLHRGRCRRSERWVSRRQGGKIEGPANGTGDAGAEPLSGRQGPVRI
jgi:thiol-disulfide isomerase/thioredoxin